MPGDEVSQHGDAIVTDGVRDFAGEDEARPARESVAARQGQLGVDERRRVGLGARGMKGGEIGHRFGVTPANGAEEILGLTSELTQVGMHGEMTLGHRLPPWVSPMSAGDGRRRFSRTGRHFMLVRWTRPFPRTGGALRAVGRVFRPTTESKGRSREAAGAGRRVRRRAHAVGVEAGQAAISLLLSG